MVKRLFDIIAASMGLVVLSPLMLAVALAVKLEDGGPVFFVHRRIGRGFVPFGMYKFRTMVVDAASAGPAITVGGDPRVTGTGRLLRRTKLDELPQLINVLTGDMSLVGPRPEVAKYVEAFRGEYSRVLSVRPGVTDYASIVYRDEESVLAASGDPERLYVEDVLPRKLKLNIEYIGRASFIEDIKIILKTLNAL